MHYWWRATAGSSSRRASSRPSSASRSGRRDDRCRPQSFVRSGVRLTGLFVRSKSVIPSSNARRTISRDRPSGAVPPKLCQRPREISGSFSLQLADTAALHRSAEPTIVNLMVQYSTTVDLAFAALADPTRRALRHVADRDEEAHPAARGGAAGDDGEGRPRPQVHARALRPRGHQHVAAAARPLRPGRRTDERRTMSPTKKKDGFTAEEKAAMRARAKELTAAAEGEEAVLSALAAMSPDDRALGERIHAIVKDTAPDLTPKTWYGMPAYANKDGKVVVFFRNAEKFKERYAMLVKQAVS